ncbi:MAG: pilus assembly protein [Deltaproteobacteria bacterium]|nr:pilus assembly protein [Deltaproteobacteria bacterium]MBI4796638.1 pilus assembly protein [Deltaproteobacteria bacterium]
MATSKRLLRSGRERGSIIVEMAVVIPLLLLMVAGIIDLGMLFWEKEVLTNAAREGARAGARAGAAGAADKRVSQVRTIVQDYLQRNNVRTPAGALITLDSSNCTYTWDTSTPPTLTVGLNNIPAKMMMLPNILPLFSGGGVSSVVNLNASISMAAEWTTTPSP